MITDEEIAQLPENSQLAFVEFEKSYVIDCTKKRTQLQESSIRQLASGPAKI